MNSEFDFIVIGGGIAGASVAAYLAEDASVLLLEMEDQPGYHATGRSAALFLRTYGNDVVRGLTRASYDFFHNPPAGFCTTSLVTPRSVLITARAGQAELLDGFVATVDPADQIERLTPEQAGALVPILRTDTLEGAILTTSPSDIEVHELHHGFLRLFRSRGGVIALDARATSLERRAELWTVSTRSGDYRAPTIINAAGAWAGELGILAGAQDIGLTPLKRTACLIEAPPGLELDGMPMLYDVEDQYYLKPDAGLLLLSPADETPSAPADAQADELDIAIAVDRIEQATTLQVRRISHRWAGLRSFVADRSPVVGFDPIQPGFFWLAGQGGFGIQTAPALGRIGALLAARKDARAALDEAGVTLEDIRPERLRQPAAV